MKKSVLISLLPFVAAGFAGTAHALTDADVDLAFNPYKSGFPSFPGLAAGTVISNMASVSSPAEVAAATADPNPGNDSATATTTVAAASEVPGGIPGEVRGSPATPGSPAEPAPAGIGAGATAGAAVAAVPVVANPTFTG